MAELIFVVGCAGAGKSTLAKQLASKHRFAFFDMDTLLRPAAESIMALQGLDPNDRDSAEYKQLCRDLGYRITMDAALENLELGINTIVVGPFTKEITNPLWLEEELSRFGTASCGFSVKVISVSLATEEAYRDRFLDRKSVLDNWKLEHWEQFRKGLRTGKIEWNLPDENVLYFDNTLPLSEERIVVLEQFINVHPT